MRAFLNCFALRLRLSVLLALGACQPGDAALAVQDAPVVLAAASLQESLTEIADAFAAGGRERPILSFAATSSLARQVEGGAPADIFIAADEQWMDELERSNLLVTGSRADLLTNTLVIVTPAGSHVQGFRTLADSERIAIADPEAVPAGRYAQAALEKLGWWDELALRIIPAENVRAALAFVERGEVDSGVVYATDALASRKVAIAYTFPPGSHQPIVYPAALIAGHVEGAGEFVDFLSSEQAQAIFRRHGFGIAS